jgi:alpha-tubulin suppressor-like RCC1 family protein
VTGFPVTWWSSNEAIARVSTTGLVTGVANGAATIFASIDSRVGAVAITVASVASVAVEPATFRLVVGGVAGPGATPRDAAGNALSRPVTWSTSNDAIATVSSTGIVTGVSLGTVTITATSEGHSASVTVTIERVALSSIVAGMNVSCGLTPAGAAYCWGDRSSGLVGNAPGIECEIEYWYYYMYTYISPCATTPTEIVTAHRFTSLAIGGYHVCGIATGGQAYCWGGNGDGQLGNGTNTPSTTPLPVAGGFTFSALAAGAGHTCGLTTAGAAYCWGTNYAGQLGNGSRVVNFTPAPVAGGLTFSNLSAGYDHTCGIADATAYCWGSNAAGALGTGGTGGQHSIPTRVSGSMVFASITAGTSYTCGVLDNGSAYCWGANAYGQLGVSGTSNRSAPTAVTGALVFSRLTAGNWHTCGVTTAGAAYCWGYNEGGRLGSGVATSFVAIPTAVAGGLLFTNLSAGSDHSCGVTTGSVAYCWGNNDFGQLGNPILTDRLAPTLVTGQP